MTHKICLFGDGGHASVLKDIAKLNHLEIEAIFDDRYKNEQFEETILLTSIEAGIRYVNEESKRVIIAIGSMSSRKRLVEQLATSKAEFINLIHPNAMISETVKMGVGNVLMPGSIINANSEIGNHCIINTAATIDHDCRVADFTQLSPGVHLCGGVHLGHAVNVGAGAIVIPQVMVADDTIIGAGAVVIKDVMEAATIVGVPARRI